MIKKKILKTALMSSTIIIPAIALTSCSSVTTSLFFAELVVSDNTSVLKDKSFSETTYKGWREFMVSNTVDPKTGHVSTANHKSFNVQQINSSSTNSTYTKEAIDMPTVNSTNKLLSQGRGIWRRPNKSRDLTFKQIFSGGSNLIIAPGFNHQQAIETVAPQEKNKGFLFLDGVPQIKDDKGNWIKEYPNVASFLFRAEQSGFLAGIAAGEFLNINKDIFAADDGKLKVGGFVGLALGSTVDFLAGFQHGIVAYNKMVMSKKLTTVATSSKEIDRQKIEWISLGNEIGQYSAGSFSPGQGTQKSRELIDKGADMIIPISGPQTSDLVSAINSQTNPRPVTIVGVDSSQENSSVQKTFDSKILNVMGSKRMKGADGKEFKKQNIIQFSAIKKLDEATVKVLAAIFNEKDPNNKDETGGSVVKGFGYLNVGSLGNETAGISDNGMPYIFKAFPDWKKTVTSKENSDKLDPQKVYKNDDFISLETNGRLYKDISNITSSQKLKDLNDSAAVTASVLQGQGNKLVSPLKENEYSPIPSQLYKKEKPLDGSKWGQHKGEILQKHNEIIMNKKDD